MHLREVLGHITELELVLGPPVLGQAFRPPAQLIAGRALVAQQLHARQPPSVSSVIVSKVERIKGIL